MHGVVSAAPAQPTPSASGAAGALLPEIPSSEASNLAKSPRATVSEYLELCRQGNLVKAADLLQLPEPQKGRGAELALRLKQVLDRRAWLDLDTISELDTGDPNDGLAPNQEDIARLPLTSGGDAPVRLVRVADTEDARWLFSKGTVERIDTWYADLDDHWLLEHIPRPLLRPGPGDLLWWQWIALPLVLAVAGLGGLLLGRLTRAAFGHLARRTATTWDDAWLERALAPLVLAWTIACAYALLPFLGLYEPAQALAERALRAGLFLVFFWTLFRIIDVIAGIASQTAWATAYPASRSLVPLGARVSKVGVLAIAVVAMLAQFGYPVASLVAGLGIGGLAVALAAQKTVENLFGAFSIGVDQPFREGDFVKIEDFVGTVEAIGLRSTRVRTLDRTLVSIPNGKLAELRVETFTARDRIRLFCTLGLVYETTSQQMREVLAGLERILRKHPKIWPEAVIVRFKEFGASSLDIDVMAWFQTQDWNEFQLIRQEVLLDFMGVVEAAGSSFAFPTRTLHIAGNSSKISPVS
jgi:MscS family membrane protein